MDKKLKAKWVKALRSGEFKQIIYGDLKGPADDGEGTGYCCLGVLRHIINPRSGAQHHTMNYLCDAHEQRAGLTYANQERLANMNDEGKSFKQIAAWIEKNL